MACPGPEGLLPRCRDTRIMNRPLVVEEERLNFGPDDQ